MDWTDAIPHDWREWRRLRAVYLRQEGWCQRDVADAFGVNEETVSRWVARARHQGPEALLSRFSPGHPPKLTGDQKRLIPEFLWHGAEAYGFRGQAWTCARIAKVIEEEFGVRYHRDHVGRLLKELRWTPQVPIKRAIQRDEKAIECWREEIWPELQRRARRERRVAVFVDESGFYLLPSVVKTYGPAGRTPVIHEKQTRDHLSVFGGMTPMGKIYTLVRQRSLNGWDSVEFLMHLQRVAGARLLVIWDGSPIHRRGAVNDFVLSTRGKVCVERLPGYAPDLNPWDEGGWHHLKNIEMRNLVCLDLEQLHQELHLAVGRFRQKPQLVQSCFAQAGLALTKT